MTNSRLILFLLLFSSVVTLALGLNYCTDPVESGICPECSPTPTGEPFPTGEVTPEATAPPPVFGLIIVPQRYDFDNDCTVSILDLTSQAGDFGATYPNYDGWTGVFDAERERLEDHDVDLDTAISILDLTLTARAFGLSWDPPCAPVVD